MYASLLLYSCCTSALPLSINSLLLLLLLLYSYTNALLLYAYSWIYIYIYIYVYIYIYALLLHYSCFTCLYNWCFTEKCIHLLLLYSYFTPISLAVCACVSEWVSECVWVYIFIIPALFLWYLIYIIYVQYVYIGVCRVVVLLVEREPERRSELCHWTSLLQMCVVMHGGVREGGSAAEDAPPRCRALRRGESM
jgi:hypothetical protein